MAKNRSTTEYLEQWKDDFGNEYRVHKAKNCSGICAIHSPSDHSMSHWKRSIRIDKGSLIERHCPTCGAGHPDPDCLRHMREIGVAGAYTFMNIFGYSDCCEGNKK